ncbi:MAG: DNA translocase FtsK [Bacteroidales bacterium]|nr:DNA translocase FtsK [Bacteroidales bacterium]
MRFVTGILVSGIAVYLLLAFIGYLIWWKTDLSIPAADILSGPDVQVKNPSGKSGHYLAYMMISNGFGLSAFFIPMIFATLGLYLLKFPKIKFWNLTAKFVFATIILSLILGFIFGEAEGYLYGGPGGAHGYHLTNWLNAFVGKPGTAILLILLTLSYFVFALKIPLPVFRRKERKISGQEDVSGRSEAGKYQAGREENADTEFFINNKTQADDQGSHDKDVSVIVPAAGSLIRDMDNDRSPHERRKKPDIRITRTEVDDLIPEEELERIMKNYDPRLDLSNYRFPPVSILRDHRSGSAFDNNEVLENKDNIIKTLGDYKISIRHISATVGPTVTLYEIIPERGVKLARIKSLEDDIALNLSAIGIRIIAPIPGRGTVGIEVPNKKPEIVSMKSLIASRAFQESRFDIALALGRTITNDPYIVDLTKMPHLLVAGATGQGKSVGLNTIITSILYKKHPAELKFVLIDPKRVELPLYSKIERHYLAKLPDEEDAIITDTQKVINTLYSLCIEMDNRLELLKTAQSRNIKEYNEKFITRRLNPEKGHRYLPYIILVIDEFADLIMTAGREIEGPLGRLAQVARAIGIHLIISTQRPTTNIITGFIKANFPTRIAFRVFSSIDSRTILDVTGADRLVGNGDMLISSGAEPVRVQCAYVDTKEIEELTEYIGSQQGYPGAMHLPEYINDTDAGSSDMDMRKKDALFEEAARLVVQHQQGSTSLIQRRLSVGYNRAGRIIDQLEAAGIVGPFEGSKAREVFCDSEALEQILKDLE